MTDAVSPDADPLVEALLQVELPTLGHFLEEGFCDPRIRPIGEVGRMAGRAVTVDLTEPDAIAVNRALVRLRPGSVLVIRVHGGRHAPVGAVTAAAALARGAVGIVVDGPVTDLSALSATAAMLPVFATGTTALTTKRRGTATAGIGRPVIIGGVCIADGDVVAGDENGVVAFRSDALSSEILDAARRSDDAEPELLARIRRGDPFEDLLALDTETL